jgi:hypothetical protein
VREAHKPTTTMSMGYGVVLDLNSTIDASDPELDSVVAEEVKPEENSDD